MAKEKSTPQTAPEPAAAPTFEVVGYQISDEMNISIDGRQVNLVNPSPELTAWLFERRDRIAGLKWSE